MITDSAPKNIKKYVKIDADVLDFKIIFTWVLANQNDFFYVVDSNPKKVLTAAIKSVALIKAAGGVVENENNEFLFILRNGKWDIPKGKVEKKEKVKLAAVREVEEECGIKVSTLGEEICKTYHVYSFRGEIVIKKTFWYNMRCKNQGSLTPQLEEGITDARWFKKNDLAIIVENTYPLILDVLKKKKLFKAKQAPLLE